ncbi:MAG TPA: alkaline phosphatase family protein [Trebonia sp.]|jgi:phospholipase C
MAGSSGLASIEHIVVLMLENRSFDHMLGYLYTDAGNQTPSGQAYEGLTGKETNPDSGGSPVPVFQITQSTANAYFMPGADPGEGYKATNDQLWGSDTAPASGTAATSQGFVKDYAYTLGWEQSEGGWSIVSGTTANDIMGCYAPEALPVLSALAKGYAVCDYWYASAPTETLPNRAFLNAGTSQGHMDDDTKTYTCPTIYGSLTTANVSWKIYGYDAEPLTKSDFPDLSSAPAANFGLFTDFQSDAKAGSLPSYAFLEPSWGSSGNSQHPNYDVALGEQLIYDTYEALRSGPDWDSTLFVLTYDEHGGCYDHVAPPWGATPPDTTAGEYGFGFDRFGVRVPALLISPLIAEGTVYRVPAGSVPLDHTSVLKTIEQRWNIPALTKRDAAAPGFGDVITLTTPRTDDVLSGVTVPTSGGQSPSYGKLSKLEGIREELIEKYSPYPRPPVPAPPVASGKPEQAAGGKPEPEEPAKPKKSRSLRKPLRRKR